MIDRRLNFLLVPLAACCQCFFFGIVPAHADSPKPPTSGPAGFSPYIERVPKTLVKFEMLPIPPGKFLFSPDGKLPPKAVEIKRFWLAKTECTWNDFQPFYMQNDLPERERHFPIPRGARTRPSAPYFDPTCGFGTDGYPAIVLSAHSASMYCKWLTEKTRRRYRLPTEAEWEYACRASGPGEKLNPKQLDEVAWHSGNSEKSTHPVVQKLPNRWGLYDMLGNAGEWCTPMEGNLPVLRGGSYTSKPADVHCLARAPFDPAWQINDTDDPKSKWWLFDAPFTGFRVLREE